MTCREVEDAILDGAPASEVSAHIDVCESCQKFASDQRLLDSTLTGIYQAPQLSHSFRHRLDTLVRREKRAKRLSWLPGVLAVASGLVSTAACIYLLPNLTSLILPIGVGLSAAAYLGPLAFEWLVEELGEA